MRRQTKKLGLTLLLSVALVSTNMQFVSAQEEPLPSANTALESQSSDALTSSQDAEKAESSNETTQTEGTNQTESGADATEGGFSAEGGAVNSSTTNTDTGTDTKGENSTEKNDASGNEEGKTDVGAAGENGEGNTETGAEDNKEGNNAESGAADGEEAGKTDGTEQDADKPVEGEDGKVSDDTAAADQTEEETPEQAFVNKNGEEVLPSTLVGVDYNTIAEDYDGETNAVKQYVVSDEYAKDTIVDSYIDENGNLIIVISQGVAASTVEEDKTVIEEVVDFFSLDASSNGSAPAVDGSFTGWDDIPPSYEFNWNKPDAWVDGEHYTETNSTDVRHEMKLYSDGENVYLKVVFAREFYNGQIANGNDYQFWIDDEQMAAYQVQWSNGSQLSYNTAEPGVYQVEVRHRDSSWSYVLTEGAVAYYHINDGNLNNELELKIPLSEFVKQNPNINLDNYGMIGFFTPNLMQNKIYTAGASTGAEPFAVSVFLLVPASYLWFKKKDEREDMAFA